MSETAEVVVVGAGIAGVTAALELQRAGIADVLVLDRDEVASGTTRFGAGSVGMWAGGYVPSWGEDVVEIERYTLGFYRDLAATGAEFGYTPNGSMWIATTAEAKAGKLQALLDGARDDGARALDPDEVATLSGDVIRAEHVVGGVLYPKGAQVTAPKAALAVAEAFRRRGGRIAPRRPVESLLVRDGRVRGVRTARGTIETGTVVLAAGAWCNELLAEHGAQVPYAPLVLSRIVTEPLSEVPSTMPFCFAQEFDGMWLRPYEGGLLWGCAYQSDVRYRFVDGDGPPSLRDIPFDAYRDLRRAGARAARAIPILEREDVGLTFQQGLPCYTADAQALVGRIPGIEGLLLLAGDNEAGISHGPGHARLVAAAISTGTDVSVPALRPSRFADAPMTARDVVDQMADDDGSYFA